jgi:hypothetical protein
MRGALLAVFLLALGCAPHRITRQAPVDPVAVRGVTARFLPQGEADFECDFEVTNPEHAAGSLNGAEWEIWVQGRWFAAGTLQLAEPLPAAGRELKVDLRVLFRRIAVKPGPSSLELGLRGGLNGSVDGNSVRLTFQRTLTVASQGAPVFGTLEED